MAQTRYANQHQMSGKSKVKMVGTYLTAAAGAPSPRPFFVPTFSAASRGGRSGLFGIIGRTRRSRPHRARSDHPVGRTPRLTSVYLGRLPSSVCTLAARQHFIGRQPVALTLRHLFSGLLQCVYQLFELQHSVILRPAEFQSLVSVNEGLVNAYDLRTTNCGRGAAAATAPSLVQRDGGSCWLSPFALLAQLAFFRHQQIHGSREVLRLDTSSRCSRKPQCYREMSGLRGGRERECGHGRRGAGPIRRDPLMRVYIINADDLIVARRRFSRARTRSLSARSTNCVPHGSAAGGCSPCGTAYPVLTG